MITILAILMGVFVAMVLFGAAVGGSVKTLG
jgi:hypothetical protein